MARTTKRETKPQQEAKRFLASVPDEHVFWSHDGRILHDIRELGEALTMMSDETFAYHYNVEKKDFSNWARDLIGDAQLANRLDLSVTRLEAASAVSARIAALSRRLG